MKRSPLLFLPSLTALMLAAIHTPSDADARGGRESHGGEAIACYDRQLRTTAHGVEVPKGARLVSVELFDYWAWSQKTGLKLDLGSPQLNVEQKVQFVLNRLKAVDPHTSEAIRAYLPVTRPVFVDRATLPKIDDSSEILETQAHCQKLQVAVQLSRTKLGESRVAIDRSLFEKMPADHQAGLLLHEAIYGLLIDRAYELTSDAVRYFNFMISTGERWTRETYAHLLISAGGGFASYAPVWTGKALTTAAGNLGLKPSEVALTSPQNVWLDLKGERMRGSIPSASNINVYSYSGRVMPTMFISNLDGTILTLGLPGGSEIHDTDPNRYEGDRLSFQVTEGEAVVVFSNLERATPPLSATAIDSLRSDKAFALNGNFPTPFSRVARDRALGGLNPAEEFRSSFSYEVSLDSDPSKTGASPFHSDGYEMRMGPSGQFQKTVKKPSSSSALSHGFEFQGWIGIQLHYPNLESVRLKCIAPKGSETACLYTIGGKTWRFQNLSINWETMIPQ